MAVRRDRPGPPAGKDFDPEHYYNLWRYVTRFIRYSDLGQALVVTGGASGTSTTGTLTLAVASGSGGGGFGTIAGAGDLNGTSTTGTLTAFLSTLAGTFFQVGAVPNLLNFNGTDANGFQMQLWGSHANGVNFLMRGTGATPRKYLRVVGAGVLEVVNNAYTQTLLSINDSGTTTAVAFGAGFSQWGTESTAFLSGGTGTFVSIRGGDLGTMARFSSYVAAGDALGTSTTGTLTLALNTTGVSTGTVGGITGIPVLNFDASGRALSAGVTTTLAPAIQIGTATTNSGELLTVRGAIRIGRQDTGAEGGQINFERASDATIHWSLDLNGTGSSGNTVGFRFIDNVAGIAPLVLFNNVLQVGSNISIGGTGTAAGWSVTGTSTAAAAQFGTASGQFARWGTSSHTLIQGGAESITGTGTYGGVLSTRALSGAIGSSGSQSNAITSPYLNATPVSITTVAGTLMGYGLPANAITGSGQGVEFSMWGTAQLSPSNGGLIVKLGTATLINGTSTIAPSAWVVEGQVVGQASGQQQFFTRFAVFTNNGAGIEQINVGTLGMNLSTVTTLHMAGTGTNSNARQQNGMTVKFMGLQ